MKPIAKYDQLQAANPDILLLVTDPDFYMAFNDSAYVVARACNISAHPMSHPVNIMCGFPRFDSDRYLKQLDAAGIRFAIIPIKELTP